MDILIRITSAWCLFDFGYWRDDEVMGVVALVLMEQVYGGMDGPMDRAHEWAENQLKSRGLN